MKRGRSMMEGIKTLKPGNFDQLPIHFGFPYIVGFGYKPNPNLLTFDLDIHFKSAQDYTFGLDFKFSHIPQIHKRLMTIYAELSAFLWI
jgi:hypothetical protein